MNERQWFRAKSVSLQVARRFTDDRCLQIASSLSFTTLLGVVPLVTVALGILSFFPRFDSMRDAILGFAFGELLPPSLDMVSRYAGEFTRAAGQLTVVGTIFLAVTAVAMMTTIDDSLNSIWRVQRPRPEWRKVLIYVGMITAGPVLTGASILITSWFMARSEDVAGVIPGAGLVTFALTPILLTSLAATLLFMVVPNRRIAFRDAAMGGVIAAGFFELMKNGFAQYVTHFTAYRAIYGTFALVPVFLLWVYLSWCALLLGAAVAAVLPEWRRGARSVGWFPGSDFVHALLIVRVLMVARMRVVSFPEIMEHSYGPAERVESVIHQLEGHWLIRRSEARGWILSADPATLTIGDLHRLFVYAPDAVAALPRSDDVLGPVLERILRKSSSELQLKLADLFEVDSTAVR